MFSILVTKSKIQTLQHLFKSTHKNNSKTRSTDSLFGVWYATLFNISTQFKLNLSSIGDICVASPGARGSNHILAHLPFRLECACKASEVLDKRHIDSFAQGWALRSVCPTSSQVMPPTLVHRPRFK